jgi:hypothetical protein
MEFLHGVRIVIVRSDENLLGFLKGLQSKILNERKSEGSIPLTLMASIGPKASTGPLQMKGPIQNKIV